MRKEYQKIEVKTTSGTNTAEFYMSENELEIMRECKKENIKYIIYRLYNYNSKLNTADFYIIEGDVEKQLDIKNHSYRVTIK